MPFVSIATAALILSGKSPTGDTFKDIRAVWAIWGTRADAPTPGNELAARIATELITGAKLGKIPATVAWRGKNVDAKKFDGFSLVDLDDAREFIHGRGILSSGGSSRESRRQQQLRLLGLGAAKLGLDTKSMKRGQGAKLRDHLQKEYPSLFSNWLDIWKAAIKTKIAKPIKKT